MQFHQLRQFCAIVDYGSMSQAAERAYVSQSALTQSIQKLEREFGIRLFHRHAGKKLELTPQGIHFLQYARQILALEQEMYDILMVSHRSENTINLHSPGTRLMPALLQAALQEHPEYKINVKICTRTENIQALIDRRADLIFDYGNIYEPDKLTPAKLAHYISNDEARELFCKRHNVCCILYYTTRLGLCVPKNSLYHHYKSITLEELCHIPVIRTNSSTDFESWLDLLLEHYGLKLNTIMTLDRNSYDTMLIEHGYCSPTLTTHMANDPRVSSNCLFIPVSDPLTSLDFYIYYQKNNPSIREFVHMCMKNFDWELLLRTPH